MAHLLFAHDLLCRPEEEHGGLLEEIRRKYEYGVDNISVVTRKWGAHRRMVREAIERSVPIRTPAKERARPTISPVAEFIDEMLEADRRASSAISRIAFLVRITRERSGYSIAESTVRRYVRQRNEAHMLLIG
jgi:hypothetical protein